MRKRTRKASGIKCQQLPGAERGTVVQVPLRDVGENVVKFRCLKSGLLITGVDQDGDIQARAWHPCVACHRHLIRGEAQPCREPIFNLGAVFVKGKGEGALEAQVDGDHLTRAAILVGRLRDVEGKQVAQGVVVVDA